MVVMNLYDAKFDLVFLDSMDLAQYGGAYISSKRCKS